MGKHLGSRALKESERERGGNRPGRKYNDGASDTASNSQGLNTTRWRVRARGAWREGRKGLGRDAAMGLRTLLLILKN